MMTIPLPRRGPRLALLLLPFLAACRGEPAPAPAPLTAEQKDHKELSRQPSEEWTPSSTPRKLNILFLLDKNRIRKGETFRYRLEMQNLGQEPLAFKEAAPSFIKDGSLCGSGDIKLYAAPPDGKETLLTCKPAAAAAAKGPDAGLDLLLEPGEYLLTRGSGSKDNFRELQAKFSFAALGTYRLKAVYAPGDGFRAVSNTVTLEVVP
ncbi:MAG: hypothetical protein NDJ72_11935 [Elusimicrobia bacterium]|nr:hypothetical protein [Elusimicrobiota bacterium]